MKIILILLLILISHCSSSTHDYVDKEVLKVQSNVSPSISKLAGETSAGLLFLAFDIYGYLNFNLNGDSKKKTFNTCFEKKNWVYY